MTRNRSVFSRLAGTALFVVLVAWLSGFLYFLSRALVAEPDDMPEARAVVVLTGGARRIDVGLAILKANPGARLLISGVNPAVLRAELSAISGEDAPLYECCVDLDRTSTDTLGNARETALWARKNGFDRVMLVTAAYHMPRSLIVLRRAMPEVRVEAYPVQAAVSTSYLLKEYHKYLFTLASDAAGI